MEIWLDAHICADSSPISVGGWGIFRCMKPIVRCLRLFAGSGSLSGSFTGSSPWELSSTAQGVDLLILSVKSKRFAASDDRFTAAKPFFKLVTKPIRKCGTRIALALGDVC